MHTTDLRTASLNDMVFEGRNKAYGAYILRQLYHRHLAKALIIAVSLSLVLLVSPILMARLFPETIEAAAPTPVLERPLEILPPPDFAKEKPAGGSTQRVEAVVQPNLPKVPTVVPNDQVKPEVTAPVAPTVGPITDEGLVGPANPGAGTGIGTGTGTGTSDSGATKAPAAPPVFLTAEVMPEFVGGNAALVRYLQKNLHYPPQALRNSIDGKVFIAFTVQADGSIADVQVLKGLGYGTDEEAARVVKNMPAWTPGQQNKHTVSVRYTLPITFRYE